MKDGGFSGGGSRMNDSSFSGGEPFLERTYRKSFRAPDLTFFHIAVEQTDLLVGIGDHAANDNHGRDHAANDNHGRDHAANDSHGRDHAANDSHGGYPAQNIRNRNGLLTARILQAAEESAGNAVLACRGQLETQIRLQPGFLTSLVPLALPVACPLLIAEMVRAARLADVGPMAAVAGAVAERVGRMLAERFSEVLVENGGDIWITGTRDRAAGLFCGNSPLNGKLGLRLPAGGFPLGLCTSSGTIGHSLSFGRADAATVKAKSASLADAVATGFGNRVKTAEDIPDALEWASSIPGILGLLVVIGDRMGVWGDMELKVL